MNTIVNNIIEQRKGHYCHALEVSSTYELESIVESLASDFISDGHTTDEIKEFFNSAELYALEDENEDEIYNFDFDHFIDELY